MRKKRRKKAPSKTKAPKKRARLVSTYVKPPGIRAEDVPEFALFQFNVDDDEEIHLRIPHEYGYGSSIYTIKLKKNGKDCFEYSSITTKDTWEYEIKILKEKVVRIEVLDSKHTAKILTKRAKKTK